VYVLFSVLLVPSANAQTLSMNPLLLVSCSLTCISDPNGGNCGLSSTRSMRGSGSIMSERAAYFVQYIGVIGAPPLLHLLYTCPFRASCVRPIRPRSETTLAIPRRSSPWHLHRRLGRRYPRSINWWWWLFNQRLPLPLDHCRFLIVVTVFVPPTRCAAPEIARALRERVACTTGYIY
jgi:hypothetical protein